MRNLDTALLRAFVTAAETGNVTRAAALLHVTQAAVSQQLKRLEEALEQPLFARNPKGLALLPAGERLLPQARRMLLLNDEIWSEMTAPEYEGEVRLGVPRDLVGPFLPPVLRRFDQAWPRVQLTLKCGGSPELLRLLEAGAIDLTLSTLQAPPPGAELLAEDRLVWLGAPGSRSHLLRPLPLTFCDAGCAFRRPVIEALDRAGVAWRASAMGGDYIAELAMIEAGVAVGALMERTVPKNLKILGEKAGLPPLPRFGVLLHLPPGGASPLVLELARHLREGFGPSAAVPSAEAA